VVSFDYTQAEFNLALKENLTLLTQGKKASQHPTGILLGGQSGAGKSAIHGMKAVAYQGNIIIIDGDSFRTQHPRSLEITKQYGKEDAKYTAQFAGQMTEALIDRLSDLKYNLLIEGTLRTSGTPERTAKLLLAKGYQTQLAIMATKPDLSYLGTLNRYEMMFYSDPVSARATDKAHHNLIVDGLVENANYLVETGLFDKIEVYDRFENQLFPVGDQTLVTVLNDKLFGSYSSEELLMLDENIQSFEALTKINGHLKENQDKLNYFNDLFFDKSK
jgi:UDP-N-acetylglucosamine kinase